MATLMSKFLCRWCNIINDMHGPVKQIHPRRKCLVWPNLRWNSYRQRRLPGVVAGLGCELSAKAVTLFHGCVFTPVVLALNSYDRTNEKKTKKKEKNKKKKKHVKWLKKKYLQNSAQFVHDSERGWEPPPKKKKKNKKRKRVGLPTRAGCAGWCGRCFWCRVPMQLLLPQSPFLSRLVSSFYRPVDLETSTGTMHWMCAWTTTLARLGLPFLRPRGPMPWLLLAAGATIALMRCRMYHLLLLRRADAWLIAQSILKGPWHVIALRYSSLNGFSWVHWLAVAALFKCCPTVLVLLLLKPRPSWLLLSWGWVVFCGVCPAVSAWFLLPGGFSCRVSPSPGCGWAGRSRSCGGSSVCCLLVALRARGSLVCFCSAGGGALSLISGRGIVLILCWVWLGPCGLLEALVYVTGLLCSCWGLGTVFLGTCLGRFTILCCACCGFCWWGFGPAVVRVLVFPKPLLPLHTSWLKRLRRNQRWNWCHLLGWLDIPANVTLEESIVEPLGPMFCF